MRKPRPHQRAAIAYARRSLKSIGGAALFMQMRLGKSLCAIHALKGLSPDDPVLILTPSTTVQVWLSELAAEGIEGIPLIGSSKKKLEQLAEGQAASPHLWFVTNPEGVRACPAIADAMPWAAVILDESGGWFTNPRAKVVKLIQKKLITVPKRLILTGTPDPRGPEDYFEQCRFVCGGEFMGHPSFWTWRLRFTRPTYYGRECSKTHKKKIKSAVREVAFRLTAKQAGVFLPRVYETRHVEPPPEIRKALKEVRRDLSIGDKETKWVAVAHGWQSQLAGGSIPGGKFNPFKVNEVIRLLQTELKGQKVIVWARFTRELKNLQRLLTKAGFRCDRISGQVPVKKRHKILKRLEDGKLDCVAIQSTVGQYALNLSFADAMIFFSNVWAWGVRSQQEARCDGIGKTQPALLIDLVAEGTTDAAVLETLCERKRSSAQFAHRVFVKFKKGSR